MGGMEALRIDYDNYYNLCVYFNIIYANYIRVFEFITCLHNITMHIPSIDIVLFVSMLIGCVSVHTTKFSGSN